MTLEGCHFKGLGDDALNVHSLGGEVKTFDAATGAFEFIRRSTDRKERQLSGGWASAGDSIAVYDPETLALRGRLTLASFEKGRGATAPGGFAPRVGDLVANERNYPDVRIANCSVENTRARAFLLQTRKFTIENCRFRGLKSAAVILACDMVFWNEMGPFEDAVVRDCTFEKCGMNGSPANLGALTVKTSHDVHPGTDPAGVHRDIRIVGCRFTNCGNSGVFVSSTDGVKVRDNMSSRCSVRRFSEKNENTLYGIWLNNCANVSIDGNTTDKDAKYLSQVTEQTK